MYNDSDVDACAERLCSTDSSVRAFAADEATDGVTDWGWHSYTELQARRIAGALVAVLAVESDDLARESIVNALATLVVWDLVPGDKVARALAIPRPEVDPAAECWGEIEDWARRHGA